MTPTETTLLCRYVKACCPQQAVDDFTPDAWHDLLGDLPLDDCRAAVVAVARRQPFVAPAEIREEVRRIRSERIGPDGPGMSEPVPAADPDDVAGYLAALREQRARAGDGSFALALPAGDGTGGYDDNPHVERIMAGWRAERDAAARRKAALAAEEREALAVYRHAVDELLALPDHGAAVLARARAELLSPEQAAQGFPLRSATPGVLDDHKITVHAAWLAGRETS